MLSVTILPAHADAVAISRHIETKSFLILDMLVVLKKYKKNLPSLSARRKMRRLHLTFYNIIGSSAKNGMYNIFVM